jgi:AcrR family transcriptional regulator
VQAESPLPRPERRRRVPALAPDERRAELIAATLTLLREHGLDVSTRQIAQAAGVAEGTIFRVFPDKPSLICAAVASAFDPAPTISALAKIPPTDSLRDRLISAAAILAHRVSQNASLLAATRGLGAEAPSRSGPPAEIRHALGRIVEAVTELVQPDRELLRCSPAMTAQLFFSMIVTTTRGGWGGTEPMNSDEIVALLLDGLLAPAT